MMICREVKKCDAVTGEYQKTQPRSSGMGNGNGNAWLRGITSPYRSSSGRSEVLQRGKRVSYDDWKTTEPDPDPSECCERCGKPMERCACGEELQEDEDEA